MPIVMQSAAAQEQQGNSAPAVPVAEAPTPISSPAIAAPRYETVRVALQTSDGPIVLELEKERAPITTANFLRYVDAKLYDGGNFYRAINIAENFGLVQGGTRLLKAGEKYFPAIAHEPTSKTGLTHETGTISMARTAQGTARTDFFITVGDMSSFNAQPDQPGDNAGSDRAGFAAFGRVVEGMDVIMKIMGAPISPTLGEKEGMKGQMLANPVKILTARKIMPEKR
ncbi:MAG: peptidylprolyl isomerase [Sphingobium sp.]|nr:peptidylprolyl isomerase [Sphingobium sp.]